MQSSVAHCPVCNKAFRPRSLDDPHRSVLAHIKAKRRQGDPKHTECNTALYKHAPSSYGCPGCDSQHISSKGALVHFELATDDHHLSKKILDEAEIAALKERGKQQESSAGKESLLYAAAKGNNASEVKRFLDEGVAVNKKFDDGYTAIMTAAEAGLFDIVQLFIDHKETELDARNVYGQSALSMAASRGHRAVVEQLINARDFQINVEAKCGEYTPMQLASKNGHSETALMLNEAAEAARERRLAASGEVYQQLLTMKGGVYQEFLRNKIMFTGEGRNGKTCTRKALKREVFDPKEKSTRGTEHEDLELLTLEKEDVSNWKPHVPFPDQFRRAQAAFVAQVVSGKMTIEQIEMAGADANLINYLRRKQMENDQQHRQKKNESADQKALPLVEGFTAPEQQQSQQAKSDGGTQKTSSSQKKKNAVANEKKPKVAEKKEEKTNDKKHEGKQKEKKAKKSKKQAPIKAPSVVHADYDQMSRAELQKLLQSRGIIMHQEKSLRKLRAVAWASDPNIYSDESEEELEEKDLEDQSYDATDDVLLLVDECLKRAEEERALVLSMWDFGGQKLFFTLHHLFLTPQGVYLVIFNAQELILGQTIAVDGNKEIVDSSVQARCLEYVRLWCNSIFLFAPGAPILLVATHKDKLSTEQQQEAYDILMERVLNKTPSIETMTKSPTGQLCFFVTNVSKGNPPQQDPSIDVLRMNVESLAIKQPHVHEKAPIDWLAVRDRLAAVERTEGIQRMALDGVMEIGQKCGLGKHDSIPLDVELSALLKKFHDLGLLVWYDKPWLRDMVVLNPQWLINAASTVIRDPTLHPMACDPQIRRKMKSEWKMLFEDAVLDAKLFPLLYPDDLYSHKERYQIAVLLEMFGLIVRLYHDTKRVSWLVPSLLKEKPKAKISPVVGYDGRAPATCYLFFDLNNSDSQKATLSRADLEDGFLPAGLFPRIVGNAVSWAQQTNGMSSGEWVLTKSHALLIFGVDEFAMDLEESINCIKLTIVPMLPTGVFNRVLSITRNAINEFLGGRLTVTGLIKYDEDNYVDMVRLGLQVYNDIELKAMKEQVKSEPKFKINGEVKSLAEIREQCWQWTFQNEAEEYDVYVSYLEESDGWFAAKLHDCQRSEKLEATGRAPSLFPDRSRLQAGRRIAEQIIEGISKSRSFVPIISKDVIKHLAQLGEESENANKDNACDLLLLEWWAALTLGVGRIVPIFLPNVVGRGMQGEHIVSLQSQKGLFNAVPDGSLSTATFEALSECIVKRLNLPAPEKLTIRTILDRIVGNMPIDPAARGHGGGSSKLLKGVMGTRLHETDNPLWMWSWHVQGNLSSSLMICTCKLIRTNKPHDERPPSESSPVFYQQTKHIRWRKKQRVAIVLCGSVA
eukprot:m.321960 g.321960  ORF g.321960 m.321960 type:complete len:1371 (-) comp16530_c1_seq36:1283-5395(-)